MASRKEDEKNEKIIRNLLKLPDNRRCINCNSLGSQYVCTNFWTFVCTNCSGIHREFTHRVKSVSMAKFTSQEVKSLQGGGNAKAKEIYFKEWDPQRQSLPDGSNVERLRNFIKHVYVERRYTGERSFEKPPTAKTSESGDFNDHRRTDSYQSGSRSPPYDEDRRYNDRQSSGGRSPEYDLENRQHGDYKRSPARAEVVNDWRREDRFGNETRSEDIRTSGGGSRSPDSQIYLDASSPPVVRPVREILGENITPLRVIEPPKANGIRSPDSTIRTQRTESSSSLASSNGNPAELKVEASLIDFDAVPEPPVVGAAPQPQPQVAAGLHTMQTAQSDGDNWANFDSVADVKISHVASNLNPLESIIAELSVPASGSLNLAGNRASGALPNAPTNASNFSAFPTMIPATAYGSPFGSVAPAAPVNSSMPFPFAAPATAAHPVSQQPMPVGTSFASVANIRQQPQALQHSLFPAIGGQSVSQLLPVGSLGNQPSNPLIVPNPQWLGGAATVQMPQSGIRPTMGFTTGVGRENSYQNAKPSDMKELPEDLFAFNYSPVPAPVRGWHTGPQTGMGFSLQYNTPMPVPTFPQASKSTNPFDVSHDPSPAATFPSISSLQGALPTMPASGGQLHASSLGHHPSHSSTLVYHAPPHPPLMASSAYLGQQLSGNMPSRPHGQVQFGHEGAAFGAFNANPQSARLQSTNATPNTLSPFGGNPFG